MNKIFAYVKGDKLIWGIVILLYLISMLTVYSVRGGITYKHFLVIILGFALMYITHLVKYTYYAKLSQLAIIIVLPLLIATLFQVARNSASRWLDFGGLTFQTSDFAKVVLIMYTARILAKNQDNIQDLKKFFLPLSITVGLTCLLIFPENLSTAAILFITSVILFFIGRVNIRYIMIMVAIAVGIGLIYIGVKALRASGAEKQGKEMVSDASGVKSAGRQSTWKSRIDKFLHGDPDLTSQENIAKIAVARGGLIGKGPGKSTQKEILYASDKDYIYAILAEEYGFAGSVFIVLLYLAILLRTIMIVRKSPGTFGAFLSIGLCLLLVFQAFIHISVSLNLIPVTGQTLPLVSMGGTSMIFSSISFGIILSVSAEIEKEESSAKPDEGGEAVKGNEGESTVNNKIIRV